MEESIEFHQKKVVLTKEEFSDLNAEAAQKMSEDHSLQRQAKDVLIRADQHRWIHMNSWMGEPVLNLPQDMFAIQDIIWNTRPDYVIEVGVAWGGSVLFEATLLEMLGGKKVIGVDIFIPDDLRKRLSSHKKLSSRIDLIEGASTSDETLKRIKDILSGSSKVLVILDSFHTHDHVLNELRSYSGFVGKGQYLICGDTIVEHIPEQQHRDRPWGPGNNPATALSQFLLENSRFEVDGDIDRRLLLSCHPGGFLKAVR